MTYKVGDIVTIIFDFKPILKRYSIVKVTYYTYLLEDINNNKNVHKAYHSSVIIDKDYARRLKINKIRQCLR